MQGAARFVCSLAPQRMGAGLGQGRPRHEDKGLMSGLGLSKGAQGQFPQMEGRLEMLLIKEVPHRAGGNVS